VHSRRWWRKKAVKMTRTNGRKDPGNNEGDKTRRAGKRGKTEKELKRKKKELPANPVTRVRLGNKSVGTDTGQ